MTNEKKKFNELVTNDDDPTVELEALTDAAIAAPDDLDSESSALTHDFDTAAGDDEVSIRQLESDLRSRALTINRLQFDIEQFRAKWNGLEAEIRARQEITDNLNRELADARTALDRKEELLRERSETVRALQAEIRERNQALDDFRENAESLPHDAGKTPAVQVAAHREPELRKLAERQAGRLASRDARVRELQAQLERTEAYADSMRRQLQERTEISAAAIRSREYLESALGEFTARAAALETELEAERARGRDAEKQIESLHLTHAEEIRTLRFELGEAQETIAQQGLMTEQLASDLVDTRSNRNELENMFNKSQQASQTRIEELEKDATRLRKELRESREKLEAKSEAINCLLAELAKKAQQIESIVEIEDVIQEIDGRISERIADRPAPDRDRVTRLLIGRLEGQKLRFPLFKDRLTIGRTEHNDIQLKASYVSRRHAVVVTDRESTRVIDWGSKNGVFVNGDRVTEHFLAHGDTVTIGTADFRYEELPKRDS